MTTNYFHGYFIPQADASLVINFNDTGDGRTAMSVAAYPVLLSMQLTNEQLASVRDAITRRLDGPRCTSCGFPLSNFAGPEAGRHGMMCLTSGCDLCGVEMEGSCS